MNQITKLAAGLTAATLLASCGAEDRSAPEDQAGETDRNGEQQKLIVQEDEATREASTALIDRKPGETGRLEEVGSFNLFTGERIDPGSARGIYQKGRSATARIDLSGTGNAGAIRQSDDVGGGANGSSAIIGFGNDSALAHNSTAYIDQKGDEGVVRIQHQGDGNFSVGIQVANLDGSSTSAEQTQTLAGRDHRSEIVQRADGGLASVTLTQGEGSIGEILQAQTGAEASIAIKNGQGSSARVVQTGSGEASKADIDNDGAGNSLKILQKGNRGAHEATISALSRNSEVIVAQNSGRSQNASVNQNGANGNIVVTQSGAVLNKAQVDQEGDASRGLTGVVKQEGSGGRNAADIDQTGQSHDALIQQDGTGGGSVAAIDQSTDNTEENNASIKQSIDAETGTDTADVDQAGSSNRARIAQTRSSGSTGSNATITQPGSRGTALVRQDGPALKAQVDQNGNSNRSQISQAGGGAGSEASIKTASGTDSNEAVIQQRSGGTIAAIDQGSPNNKAKIEQVNSVASEGIVEADIDQGGGVQNDARIIQSGAGTERSATLTQNGNENTGTVKQEGLGKGLIANLQMSGRGNRISARQVGEGTGGLAIELQQQGDENGMTFVQRGSQLGATVSQDGDNNSFDVSQSGSDYDISVTQVGNNNTFKIAYTGPARGGGGFSITQTGGEKRVED